MTGNWHLAASVKSLQKGSFGRHGHPRRLMLKLRHEIPYKSIIFPSLNA
jgi:hypothetical protein